MSLRPISLDVNDLLLDIHHTSLSASATAASSTITVYSIKDFAINQHILIGELGDEGAELIKTHTVTAPTGSTVTFASNLVKSHPKDTPVYIIRFDQVEFSHATTLTGAKSVLTTVTMNPEEPEVLYDDSSASSGYYFTRYKNSIDSSYSDYSDAVPYTGYASNTVGAVMTDVMNDMGKEFSDRLTYNMMIKQINRCLQFIRGSLKKWSNYQEFDYVVDQMNRGEYKWAVPTTLYDKNSNRSVLNVRVGSGTPLVYIDKTELVQRMEDINHTTVATEGTVGSTTLELSSAADFDDDGTVNIYSANELYSITYTAKSGNTLTGVPASGTGSITATLAAGLNVWQGESEGTPTEFTVADGYLYAWSLISSTDAGKNIYMDFYTDIVEVDSDSDVLTPTRYDMVYHWLCWYVRNLTERNGHKDTQDGDFLMFQTILKAAIRRESSGQKHKRNLKINGIFYGRERISYNPRLYESE